MTARQGLRGRPPSSGCRRLRRAWAAAAHRGCVRRSRWDAGSATAERCASGVRWRPSCSGSAPAGASPPRPSARSWLRPPPSKVTLTMRLPHCSAVSWRRRVAVRSGCRSASIRRSWCWIPAVSTSTEHSRNQMPAMVSFDDAVHNIGHVAMLVSALAAGDTGALRDATSDRLHQERRFADAPMSQRALAAGLEHGAWCGWLSGSGPTIAMLCKADSAAGSGGVAPRRRSHEGAPHRPRRCRGRAQPGAGLTTSPPTSPSLTSTA